MDRRSLVIAVVLGLLATAGSVAIVLLALDQASGATRLGRNSYDTEFIDSTSLQLNWLLFPLLAGAAWFSARMAVPAVVGVTVPQWLAMSETVGRYAESGWGSGLEALGYAIPIGVFVLGCISVLLGWAARRVVDRRLAQDR